MWRRTQIYGSKTFWDLHIVIRNAFDWGETQIHYFKIVNSDGTEHFIKSFLDDYENNIYSLSWNVGIRKYLLNPKNKIYYIFGANDMFIHRIFFEKSLYMNPSIIYPVCISGKGIPYEQNELIESSTEEMIRSGRKFKFSDVVITDGDLALTEHKVRLLDSLYY